MPPVISCVMPVYNAGSYLAPALNSVLGQNFPFFELILVDDGSTDGSAQVCDDAAKADMRVQVVHGPNGGVAAARNRGLSLAKGKYLCFVDSDDILMPGAFAAIAKTMRRNSPDIVSFNFCFCNSEGRSDAAYPGFVAESLADFWPHFVGYYRNHQFFSLCNKAYPTAFVQQHGLRFDTSLRTGEDLAFNVQAFGAAGRIVHLSACFYEYWAHPATLTRAPTLDNMQTSTRVLAQIKAFLQANGQQALYPALEAAQLPWDAVNFYSLLLDSSKPYTLEQRQQGLSLLFSNDAWHEALLKALASKQGLYNRALHLAARRKSPLLATLPLRLKGLYTHSLFSKESKP